MLTRALFILTVTTIWAATAGASISFSSRIEFSKSENITLFDIADMRDLSLEQVQQAQKTVLFPKGDEGVSREALLSALRRTPFHSVNVPAEIEFVKTSSISKTEVKRGVLNILSAECSGCDVEVSSIFVPQVQGEIHWPAERLALGPSALLPVRKTNGIEGSWISVKLNLQKKIPVAANPIMMDQTITQQDVTMELKPYSDNLKTFDEMTAVVGLKARHYIPAHQALDRENTKKNELIKSGQAIKLILSEPTFEITAAGKAEEAGSAGDRIRVRNNTNQKTFYGKIIDIETVVVE